MGKLLFLRFDLAVQLDITRLHLLQKFLREPLEANVCEIKIRYLVQKGCNQYFKKFLFSMCLHCLGLGETTGKNVQAYVLCLRSNVKKEKGCI